jgi:hypothetical protein
MIKNFTYLPPILLSLYTCRLLILGAHIADGVVLTALACLYGVWLYLEHIKEPEANVELKERLLQVEESMKVTSQKVNAINLGTSLRRGN